MSPRSETTRMWQFHQMRATPVSLPSNPQSLPQIPQLSPLQHSPGAPTPAP